MEWHSTFFIGRKEKHEHLRLCKECFEARTDPRVSKRIREARARGDTGPICGWTT
jgi:hypothetical protein